MNAENFVVNFCRDRKEIEKVHKLGPDKCAAVLAYTFSLEPVGLSYLSRLVVASKQGEPTWISQFQED